MHSKTVVMVCTANQCRSPMAEYLLKRRLGPDSKWKVQSAGTAAMTGLRASRYSIDAMAAIGVDISDHKSRALTQELVDSARIIITMTRSQRDEIVHCYPRSLDRVFTLKSVSGGSPDGDVQDPIGMSDSYYCRTRDEIDEMMPDVVLFLHEQE